MTGTCPTCGSPLSGGSFCTSCGAPVRQTNPQRIRVLVAAGIAVLLVAGVTTYLLVSRTPDNPTGIAGSGTVRTSSTSAAAETSPSSPSNATASADADALNSPDPTSAAQTEPYVPAATGASAACVAAPGLDAAQAQQTYEATKALDGRNDTAWRCPGDASGQTLVVSFGSQVHLTSVGLLPGFDKIDPADGSDRFLQGRKIVRVRWAFDDGTSVDATPNGNRAMQSVGVNVLTSTATLTILETRVGSEITNNAAVKFPAVDITAISELSFAGLR